MEFFKKNKGLAAVLVVAALIFAGGIFLLISSMREAEDAETQKRRAVQNVQGALATEVAPTGENLAAAEANVAQLHESFSAIRRQLQSGAQLNVTSDPVTLITRIQRHISDSRRVATEAGITFPAGAGFGFDRYVEASSFPNVEFAPVVDKQRQILEYLIQELVAAGPSAITAIRRETVEVPTATPTAGRTGGTTTGRTTDASGFTIDPAISARVPGAIESLAFQVSFTGFTESLQNFLNELATFRMPIVVRSVQVTRGTPATQQQQRRPQTIEDIFGGLGGGATAPAAGSGPDLGTANRPVIEDNESQFTVVVEFIQVAPDPAQPSETAQR